MNKHMETCDGFRPDQTRLTTVELPSAQVKSSNSSTTVGKNVEQHKKIKTIIGRMDLYKYSSN